MTHSSALAILPKFLWKSVFDYVSMTEMKKLNKIRSYEAIFTDAYCKELVLGDKIGKITLIQTDQSRIEDFWRYVIDNHAEYDNLDDMYCWIQEADITNFIYITVFIKPGTYMANGCYNIGKKCSISINGSKIGQTTFSNIYASVTYEISQYYSAKYIIFNNPCYWIYHLQKYDMQLILSNCTFNDYVTINSVKYLAISNCKFNKQLAMLSMQLSNISDCTFSQQVYLYSIRHLNITKCVLNQESNIMIDYGTKVNFSNNIVKQTKSIFIIVNIYNSTVNIHNNTISDLDACIKFRVDSSRCGTNCFLMQNNHMTNVLNKYNFVNYQDNITSIGGDIQCNIYTKCKFMIDRTNTLINCGFDIDPDTKN